MLDRVLASATGVLGQLAANPRLLFAVAFAGNAVLMPYQGLFHDAILYAGQVLHSADDRFADDLFFKYGSQNDYTLLPRLLAPLALKFGVEPVFFVAYLLSNAVRLAASQALVFRVLGRSPATAAGVLLIAVADVPTGCSAVFRVNEPFFTARVPALALSILGLERVLAGRYLTAGVCLLLGLAAHPLMAFPAAAIAVTWAAWEWATTTARRGVVGAAGVLGLAAVGAYLARTAGSLDPEWRALVLSKNSYLDPLTWKAFDTLRLLVAAGTVAAVARSADRPTRRFLTVTLAAAAVGYLLGAMAVRGSWALLLQGQPYRAVWPMELLGFPAGLLVVGRLWQAGPGTRLYAVAVFTLLLAGRDVIQPGSGLLFAGMTGVGVAAAVVTGRTRSDPAWLAWALTVGLGGWAVVWYGGVVPAGFGPLLSAPIRDAVSWAYRIEPVSAATGPLARFAAVLAGSAVLLGCVPYPRRATAVAAGLGLGVSLAVFLVPRPDRFASTFDPRRSDYEFVRTYLRANWNEPRTATLYWPFAKIGTVWCDLGANSYVSLAQLSGITFSRECATESFRRFLQVLDFEIDAIREMYGPDHMSLCGEDMTTVRDRPPPTAEDFRGLVAEPDLDFVVLPRDFGGSVATNGRVWVYDCRKLRAAK